MASEQSSLRFQPAPFILGVPRSGTTLLRMMLDAHPHLAVPPETHFVPQVAAFAGSEDEVRSQLYQTVAGSARWPDFHLEEGEFRTKLLALEPFTVAGGVRCFYQMYAARFGKTRWGDKTPTYQPTVHLIQAMLPEAHFIHIVRDGRDAWLSETKTWWGGGNDAAAHAGLWKQAILATRQQARHSVHFLEIRYEDLLLHTRPLLEQICLFLELPYHAAMERYFEGANRRMYDIADLPVEPGVTITKSLRVAANALVMRPPDPGRIERWKIEMTGQDKAVYQRIAGDLLSQLGYEA